MGNLWGGKGKMKQFMGMLQPNIFSLKAGIVDKILALPLLIRC